MLEGAREGETSFNPKACTLVAEAESRKPLFAAAEASKPEPEEAPPQKKQKTEAVEWQGAAEILGLA
jgi:hypothetical protein